MSTKEMQKIFGNNGMRCTLAAMEILCDTLGNVGIQGLLNKLMSKQYTKERQDEARALAAAQKEAKKAAKRKAREQKQYAKDSAKAAAEVARIQKRLDKKEERFQAKKKNKVKSEHEERKETIDRARISTLQNMYPEDRIDDDVNVAVAAADAQAMEMGAHGRHDLMDLEDAMAQQKYSLRSHTTN